MLESTRAETVLLPHAIDKVTEEHTKWSPMPETDLFLSRAYRARQQETMGQDSKRWTRPRRPVRF